jgi:phosphatidylserine/phosphatidylglycerophosphate/cardiolipin synthase-like enzyme
VGGAIAGNRIGLARDKRQLEEKRRSLDDMLDRLKAEGNQKKIKTISTNEEHRETLFKAMDRANDKLIILSGWVTSYVVDKDFQNKLALCLQRGTDVYIGYGYQYEPRPKKDHETEAVANLKDLSEWCDLQDTKGHFVYREYPNHAKLLICDEMFAVTGSFNWLSNAGRSLNEERSWIVYDKQFISAELDIVVDGLMSPLKSTKQDVLKKIFPWSDR